jgi:hypothetical protein
VDALVADKVNAVSTRWDTTQGCSMLLSRFD